MAKLWQRSRTSDGKSQLHEIALDNLKIEKPSMIFLCGFFTTDDQPGFIAGGLKRLEQITANRPGAQTPVDLYAWSHTSLRNVFNLAAYNLRPQTRYSGPAEKLARGLILPLVAEGIRDNGDGSIAATPLPEDTARKNLRNITFFSYSAGTIVGQECFNASMKMMQQAGYTAEKARDLLQEVVMISAGNISRPSKEKNRFTTLYLIASNDRLIAAKNRIWRPLKTLFARFARRLNIKQMSGTSALISAAVTKAKWETVSRDNAADEKRRISPLFPSWTMVKSYHELPHYITTDENLNQFAKIVHYSATNAINRTAKLSPLALLEPPAGVPEQTAAAFRTKIRKAVVGKDVRI